MDYIRKKWGMPIKDVWLNQSHDMDDFCMLKIAHNLYEPAISIVVRLYGIAAARKLCISIASLPNGMMASYHSCVVRDGVARLLHLVSLFQEEPKKRKILD